jgi:hypothetical protein
MSGWFQAFLEILVQSADLKLGADVSHEAACSGIKESGTDLCRELLRGFKVGVPFASAIGSDETISGHGASLMHKFHVRSLTSRSIRRVFYQSSA